MANPRAGKVWIVAANMGYGHKRAAFPLRDSAFEGKIINAENYPGIPEKDIKVWNSFRKFAEFISNFKSIPFIGQGVYDLQEERQKIQEFYPRRDLSKFNPQLRHFFSSIKKGWGKHFIEKLKIHSLPLVSTMFTPVHMAEYFNYPGEIFCIVCDADVSRTWAPINPQESKIKYLIPTKRAGERLKLYGVKPENIYFTGFPLPLENVGTENLEILKNDLALRLLNLDPQKKYFQRYHPLIKYYLGELPESPDHPLTIMFAIGGAGAQTEIGNEITKSLAEKIRNGKIKLILAAGIKKRVKECFEENIKELNLEDCLGKNIEIIYTQNIEDYFKEFSQKLRKTDILWSKPSELSFYTALGLPYIMAPTIGWQEKGNREWLLRLNAGIEQRDPRHTCEWIFDLLETGCLAQNAMHGFLEAEKMGTFNIQKIIAEYSAG